MTPTERQRFERRVAEVRAALDRARRREERREERAEGASPAALHVVPEVREPVAPAATPPPLAWPKVDRTPGKGQRVVVVLGLKELRRKRDQEDITAPTPAELQRAAAERPKVRGDCASSPRPCPFVTCRFNTYLEVTEQGGIKLNWPNHEIDALPSTCALDIAERGPHTLEQVGEVMNVTRERLRQIEARAMRKLQLSADPELDDEGARRFRKQCKARCAATGLACGLLDGHPGSNPDEHRSARHVFRAVAAPGQTSFPAVAERDALAIRRVESPADLVGSS